MKKLLSMVLAIMMLCTLLAVPAMALTVNLEMIANGDFDKIAAGTALGSTATATEFWEASSTTSASVVNIAAEGIAANGTSVNALRIDNTTAGSAPNICTNTFDIEAGKVYKASFDYLISEKTVSSVSAKYGVRLRQGGGVLTYKYSAEANPETWSSGTVNYFDPATTTEGETTVYVTNQWAKQEFYFKYDSDLSAASLLVMP